MYAGPSGMVGGQVADMEGEQGITDLDQLRYIHEHKTADLIVFSLKAELDCQVWGMRRKGVEDDHGTETGN
ncbi:Farnesyl diphosphate synthase [compost metagenome]